jgi:hypothetical protein
MILGGALCNGYRRRFHDGLALNTLVIWFIVGECDAYWVVSYFELNRPGDGSDVHLLHVTPYFPYRPSP